MKILTLNFTTCAVKACKGAAAAFPLHPRDAELAHDDLALNQPFLQTMVARLDWPALRTTLTELGFPALPEEAPTPEALAADDKLLRELHNVLMETEIIEGTLVCGNCGHEYGVREGIATFLLPSHLT